MKTILYVGRFGLPDTAPGLRVYNISMVLRDLGYTTCFLSSMGTAYGQADTVVYDNLQYKFVNRCRFRNKIIRIAANLFELLAAQKTYRAIVDFCHEKKPDGIILYNDLYPLTKKLIKFCKTNGIPLYADVTEWYEKRKYHRLGDFIIPYWTDKRIRNLDSQLQGIIAISTYLAEYYKGIGCKNIICVPPLFKIEQGIKIERHIYNGTPTVNLVYAGSPGSKDILTPVFDALNSINCNTTKIRLDIVGLNEQQVQELCGKENLQKIGIYAHGRLSHEDTLKIVRNADFGILLRENKRYAKAGYATKFAECMANGVAMICNKIGGTDSNIESGYNGFSIESYSHSCLTNLLEELILKNDHDICFLKNNAYEYALTHYQGTCYGEFFCKLLSERVMR